VRGRVIKGISLVAPALLASLSLGCGAFQAQSDALARENRDLRRLVVETREELAAVKQDQERLRATVEYLQYASGVRPPARRDAYAGPRGTAPIEPTEPDATGWPTDPWSRGSAGQPGAAGSYENPPASSGPEASADGARPREDLSGEYRGSAEPNAGAAGVQAFAARPPKAWPSQPAPAAQGAVGNAQGAPETGAVASAGPSQESRPAAAAAPAVGAATPPPTVPDELRGTGYADGVRSFLDGQYDDAIQYFRDFIYQNASSAYADDAQYWIGEAYLRKGLYSNAIKEFNQVVLRYGSGNRGSGALLKLADVFMKIGDNVDARLSLQKLVSRYPHSEEAGEAHRLLAQMGG
jgi:tol-pal system protein YbgF